MKNSNIIKLEIRWCSVLLVVVLSLGCVKRLGTGSCKVYTTEG